MATVRWLHLVAASVWLGGMVTLMVLVVVLRRANVDVAVIRRAARAFARLSWLAMAVAIATGLANLEILQMAWAGPLKLKVTLVSLTVLATLVHQQFAKKMSGGWRGGVELLVLLLTLGVFAAAVRL